MSTSSNDFIEFCGAIKLSQTRLNNAVYMKGGFHSYWQKHQYFLTGVATNDYSSYYYTNKCKLSHLIVHVKKNIPETFKGLCLHVCKDLCMPVLKKKGKILYKYLY